MVIGDRVRDLEICKEYEIQGILLENEVEKSQNTVTKSFWRCRDWWEIIERMSLDRRIML